MKLNSVNKLVRKRLGEDFVHQLDPMWNFERDSREWQTLRSLLLNAAQIHVVGELIARKKIVDARGLLDSIENWLNTRKYIRLVATRQPLQLQLQQKP